MKAAYETKKGRYDMMKNRADSQEQAHVSEVGQQEHRVCSKWSVLAVLVPLYLQIYLLY